jgi:uncharacterized protein (TIGR03663 family)
MPVASRSAPPVLALVAAVFLLALLCRLPGLESRPLHTDEAVNAFILEETLAAGAHAYRAHDHHGPTLYYATAALLGPFGLERAADCSAWQLRLIPALCGAALAAAAFLFHPWLGLPSAFAAAVALGLSAPFVYYSVYFIHETPLLLLLTGWMAAFWRWRESLKPGPALVAGVLAGLLLATKETAALLLGLFALAALVPGVTNRTPGPARRLLPGLGLQAGAALLVVLVVFSAFGRHPDRAWDLFLAAGAQTRRGLGTEHAYPFFTYLRWAFAPAPVGVPWSAWLLAATAALGLYARRTEAFVRWLAASAGLVFLVFSALPYKTPWLMLAWLLPLALLAGAGVASLLTTLRLRPILRTGLGLLAVGLCSVETHARCVRDAVSPDNPLAYSPTSPDLARLEQALSGERDTLVQVVARDSWPLPWTLRRHRQTGYWPEPPPAWRPGFVLVGPEYIASVPASAAPFEPYELRPDVFIFLGHLPAP